MARINRLYVLAVTTMLVFSGCTSRHSPEFFLDWKFHLGDLPGAQLAEYDDSGWEKVSLPHDWSIMQSYTTEQTASSTGFLPGGIGWYRKIFVLEEDHEGKHVRVEFDGVYNNSKVWINGEMLGERPYGYSSFSYELTDHLLPAGKENILAVRVDHSSYADSRWYTGSGIFRDVRLVVSDEVHIPQWGVRITTSSISGKQAMVHVETDIDPGSRVGEQVTLEISLKDQSGRETGKFEQEVDLAGKVVSSDIEIEDPVLWDLDNPHLYEAHIIIRQGNRELDRSLNRFGIRSIDFDADNGFFLNGRSVKLKGVNIHHDAGCVGAAVPRDIWVSRVLKLKTVGCNAIRGAHNPHDPALLDVCDELGMLFISEAFDEWSRPKDKHVTWLGSKDAPPQASRSYPEHFSEWAERDIKDLVRRDFNHPSVIMWSLGNEVEWTYPYYQQASSYAIGNLDNEYYSASPDYEGQQIMARMQELNQGTDSLALIALDLASWVKELDTTRFITSGCVHPSVGFATGYCTTLDVVGFNYRAAEYDGAHAMYPEAKIYGSENWVSWPEWKAVNERDFVAGIFVWTGFAYLGEAGPWPRKGLIISMFDFAGFKTPRGHFYETLWKEDPKVYLATVPEAESEFAHSEKEGWTFTTRTYEIPKMSWLRRWEWYDIYERWNYEADERIVVQAYTNCEESELFLNGESLGRKSLGDFEDRIVKWLVPFKEGELKIKGYRGEEIADSYILNTAGKPVRIELKADREVMAANFRDVAMIEAQLLDDSGNPVRHLDAEISFTLEGPAEIIGIDNGSEFNVQDAKSDRIITHKGRALLVVQAGGNPGELKVSGLGPGKESKQISINIQ